MSNFIIYHNPRCSKSRQTLQLLEDNGITPDIILYLDKPPTEMEIKTLLATLGIPARALLRRGEGAYKDNQLNNPDLSDGYLVAMMAVHPKLIERPIVVKDGAAIIGRPPENVLTLI